MHTKVCTCMIVKICTHMQPVGGSTFPQRKEAIGRQPLPGSLGAYQPPPMLTEGVAKGKCSSVTESVRWTC